MDDMSDKMRHGEREGSSDPAGDPASHPASDARRVVRRQLQEHGATRALAHGLAMCLQPGDVLLLEGEMGAGKTTFVRGLAEALGVQAGLVASPTYVLVHIYPLPTTCAVAALAEGKLSHVDAYRLMSGDDLEALGWDQLVDASSTRLRARGKSVLCVEWASRIAAAMLGAEDACLLRFEHGIASGGAEASYVDESDATDKGPGVAASSRRSGSLASDEEMAGEADDEAPRTQERTITLQLPASWLSRDAVQHLIDKPPTRCRVTGVWVSPLARTWPFANAKAQGADLFGWLSGGYRISRDVKDDDDASDVTE